MKNERYAGALPYTLYINKSVDEILNYLSDNKICEKIKIQPFSEKLTKTNVLGIFSAKCDPQEINYGHNFNNDLLNEFYSFLLKHYKSGLGDFIMVNLELSDETFGMVFNKKRKIALKYFKINYKRISIPPSFKMKFDENRNIIPSSNFESLQRKRKSLIAALCNEINLVIPYLASDIDFFDRNLFENNKIIKEIFDFENKLKILIQLNKEYRFEKDDIFTPKTKSQIIFEKYTNDFHSLEQIDFIEQNLKDLANQNHAFVVSLFFFFKKKIKIKTPSAKIFQEIINIHFNNSFGEIKLSDPLNLEHTKRLEKINQEWELKH
jgi:hypothetical protein